MSISKHEELTLSPTLPWMSVFDKSFSSGNASHKDPSRQNSGICHDFIKGKFTRKECKYVHQAISEMTSSLSRPIGHKVCNNWSRDKSCHFSDSCRFAHNSPRDASSSLNQVGITWKSTADVNMISVSCRSASADNAAEYIPLSLALPDPFPLVDVIVGKNMVKGALLDSGAAANLISTQLTCDFVAQG